MGVAAGDRIGAYLILDKLGEGGMGEVYRARDTRLNRDVALKVLPDLFARDPGRLARFTREAQLLASLNHPNIGAIYGIEQNALVMELVEGEDLSAIVTRGPLPLADVLPIAKQIADALEAAHEQGIIHRDLKPGNIKVKADGTVKVLDFGLAKALGPDVGSAPDLMNSPTLTAPATQLGMIIGTAAYMAPEQARGKAVDRRADIWAFGGEAPPLGSRAAAAALAARLPRKGSPAPPGRDRRRPPRARRARTRGGRAAGDDARTAAIAAVAALARGRGHCCDRGCGCAAVAVHRATDGSARSALVDPSAPR